MKLKDILADKAILPNIESRDKSSVLEEFSHLAAGQLTEMNISADDILAILQGREKLGSTAVGHGVAIPHGKIPGLNKIIALFGRSKEGIDFGSHDQKPTHLFFVLLAPESAIGNYLHALARLSRLMKEEVVRTHIAEAASENLYQVLLQEDDKI